MTGVDYLAQRAEFDGLAQRVIYTGPIDALYDYDAGRLEYRGMRFDHRREECEVYQGAATLNYCDAGVPWLREEEWRFFWPPEKPMCHSWVTRSYPDTAEQLYPVNDDANNRLSEQYRARAEADGYIVAGRLGRYQYLDMHQAIAAALVLAERLKHGTFHAVSTH